MSHPKTAGIGTLPGKAIRIVDGWMELSNTPKTLLLLLKMYTFITKAYLREQSD